ncbi:MULTISPECIES: hypothetical protein [unclassified Pseudonocardia]|uniref:hypothetical protein n=1 Tax=unclassified Pseudonocardia TaxID=2619320 RepID=UPI00111523FF|nr:MULTISPECIES: hypothetical protein [unclassified Pseudonocardia]
MFLQLDEEGDDVRYIAWFTLRGRDFYWGPSGPVPETPATTFSGLSATIEIPEDVRQLARVSWKASSHESGVMHVNSSGQRVLDSSDVYVGPVTEISGPRAFALLVDKHPEHRPVYSRSLTRGGDSAILIKVPETARSKRHYFEFYLTPAGAFDAPPPIVGINSSKPLPQPVIVSLDEKLDVVLAIRHLILESDSADSNPDIGFWINLHSMGADG